MGSRRRINLLGRAMNNSIFWTIVVGVIVFAASQYVLKLILEPITSFRRTLSDISSTILFHQARITNARPDDAISQELKRLSASLRAGMNEIRFYGFLSELRIFGIPPRARIREACRELNLVSHAMSPVSREIEPSKNKDWPSENTRAIYRIGELLGVSTSY